MENKETNEALKNGSISPLVYSVAPVIDESSLEGSLKSLEETEIRTHLIVAPPIWTQIQNKATQTNAIQKINSCNVETQTSKYLNFGKIVPMPVPVYVPTPAVMYSEEIPILIPIPLPIFIPTPCTSANDIQEKIQDINENFPSNPCEGELLIMADLLSKSTHND